MKKACCAVGWSSSCPLPEALRSQTQSSEGLARCALGVDPASKEHRVGWDRRCQGEDCWFWQSQAKREIPDLQPQHMVPTALQLDASPCTKHTESSCCPLRLCFGLDMLCASCVRCTVNLENDKGSRFSGFRGLKHSSVTMLLKSFLLPSNLALNDPCRQAQVDTNVKPLSLITLYKCHSERKGRLSFFSSYCL